MTDEITARLTVAIPKPPCDLDFETGWQLLVATILAAQSTDKLINTVTPKLFAKWPTPADLAAADREDVEAMVHSTGFFRNKAKAIQGAAQKIVTDFGGEVPTDMKSLISLPGVARKTANVVLGVAYRIPGGMAVDTHAKRISNRLGLTKETNPAKVERDLCKRWPQDDWIDMSHRLILHGRYICKARAPQCSACPLNEVCPVAEDVPIGSWQDRAEAEGVIVMSRGAAAT